MANRMSELFSEEEAFQRHSRRSIVRRSEDSIDLPTPGGHWVGKIVVLVMFIVPTILFLWLVLWLA